ncbi:hypothetical protein J1N35_025059 [Gossypium stocksii]|uniref:Uncharacterized protein n=1 Tax=Gossypium stocksii TaxID=47602 RepID=A0A9D3V5X1_9ROSI|nr:hypothetical protein J1N35_025059 [Gossypium stocksii]
MKRCVWNGTTVRTACQIVSHNPCFFLSLLVLIIIFFACYFLVSKEVTQLQVEISRWDTKLNSRLKEFRDEFRGEIEVELQTLFEQYLGHQPSVLVTSSSQYKRKGILGGPPWFPSKGSLVVSPMVDLSGSAKVRVVMLHLEGKTLDWHHFFAQR